MGEHPDFCIQADRIIRMEKKVDEIDHKVDRINRHFEVGGAVGEMSKKISRLTALIEKRENGTLSKITLWVIAILAATVAGLVGANLPL